MQMKKAALALMMAATLAACGGGGSDASAPKVTIQTLVSSNAKQTVNQSGTYKIDLTGSTNEITVAAGNQVEKISITGDNNVFIIQASAIVKAIDVTGNGNTIYVPMGYVTAFTSAGIGNNVIQR